MTARGGKGCVGTMGGWGREGRGDCYSKGTLSLVCVCVGASRVECFRFPGVVLMVCFEDRNTLLNRW